MYKRVYQTGTVLANPSTRSLLVRKLFAFLAVPDAANAVGTALSSAAANTKTITVLSCVLASLFEFENIGRVTTVKLVSRVDRLRECGDKSTGGRDKGK